jgi:hypothetical protein
MIAAAIAAAPFACDVCLSTPCVTPGFYEARRIAEERMQQQHPIKHNISSTPRTTIEAIMWCIRERGPEALHEPANIERLSRCDDEAIAEIDRRMTNLGAGHAQ